MRKGRRQNIIFAAVAAVIIGAVVAYSYSAEQTRQAGFAFGNELSQIQEDVKRLQTDLSSRLVQWEEGDLETRDLLEYADSHFAGLEEIIERYDGLAPPPQFSASVELFKMSTSSQLQSDRHYVEWIKTGQESDRIRSDSLFQESFDFEMLALGEFRNAKLGYKEYEGEPAKFEPPDADIADKVDKIWENMKEKCRSGPATQAETDGCIAQADAWRAGHMP